LGEATSVAEAAEQRSVPGKRIRRCIVRPIAGHWETAETEEPVADPQTHLPEEPGGSLDQRRELRDAREQLVASREILVALGRAGANPGEILDTVVERAARLCEADAGMLNLRDGDVFRLSRTSGDIPQEFELLPEIESERQARRAGQPVAKARWPLTCSAGCSSR